MKTIKYIRVSTLNQNESRQTKTDLDIFIDKCSGSIPFKERKQGSKVFKMAENGDINTVEVHSIDRLGRNTLDILNTIKDLTELGVNVVSEKEALQTIVNGKENPTAKLMVGIMATLAEFELNIIKERQREGIEEAKKRGAYKLNGGKLKETKEQVLNKAKNRKCYKLLKPGSSIRTSAKLSGVSSGTAQKVKKLINSVN